MPELIAQQTDLFLKYRGVSQDQYEEVTRRLTRPNSTGANWFCQQADIKWIDGLMTVRFTLNEHSTTDEVKDVIARAFNDVDYVKGIAS